MTLDEYRRRRRFSRTPEPEGVADGETSQWQFVIQKHDATRLHYDLRLELDGVLKSWAVPKGPTLDPAVKRLAVHVEDHPLEYLKFEGVIPVQEYGGGTVMVWDIGTWVPRKDARLDYEAGELKFDLRGQKLTGGFMLKRLDNLASGERNQWLWIKEHDTATRSVAQLDIQSTQANSVLTGRNMDEIAADRDAVWSSSSKGVTPPAKPTNARVESTFDPGRYERAKLQTQPDEIKPCLATTSRTPPTGDNWVHEIKYDGYRMLCRRDGQEVRFLSRSGRDWTDKVGALSGAILELPCESCILDGEVVVLAEDGTSNFHALQKRIGSGRDGLLRYVVFDLLYLDGYDTTALTFLQRKHELSELLGPQRENTRLMLSEHLVGEGPTIFQQASQLGLEGIVSKRINKRYMSGRSESWLKTKCLQSREFIIGGFTPPTATRKGIGAILLGARNQHDQLQFVGKVGTGFTHEMLISIRNRLDAIRIDKSPFVNLNRRNADKGTIWVQPELIAEIEFGGWTTDQFIRFGSFRGIREDVAIQDLDVQLPDTEKESDRALLVSQSAQTDIQIDPSLVELPEELASLKLTHPDRVVYPEMGITKLGVATYYAQVARWMMPHIAGRPLSLLRCPGGVGETCFFQKRAPLGLHESVQRVQLPASEGMKTFLVVHDIVGLLALVQFGVLEFHVRGDRADRPDRPDRLVLDLDPDESLPWERTTEAAVEIRDWLAEAGLESFLKTSGGKGLHVVVPIRRRHSWPDVKQFTGKLASAFQTRAPRKFTTNPSRVARKGKILIDTLRNTRGATSIAAYSTRARSHASVSVPITWDELGSITSSDSMDLQAVIRRLARNQQAAWLDLPTVEQGITKKAWKLTER